VEKPSAKEFWHLKNRLRWDPEFNASGQDLDSFRYRNYSSVDDVVERMIQIDQAELRRVDDTVWLDPTAHWIGQSFAYKSFHKRRRAGLGKRLKFLSDSEIEENLRSIFRAFVERDWKDAETRYYGSFCRHFSYEKRCLRYPRYEEMVAISHAMHRSLRVDQPLTSAEVAAEASEAAALIDQLADSLARLSTVEPKLVTGMLHRSLEKAKVEVVVMAKHASENPWNGGQGAKARYFVAEFCRELTSFGKRLDVPAMAICDLVQLLDDDLLISEDTAKRYMRHSGWLDAYRDNVSKVHFLRSSHEKDAGDKSAV